MKGIILYKEKQNDISPDKYEVNRFLNVAKKNNKDKLLTQQILASSDFPVPKTILAKYPVNSDIVDKQLGFPVVVKTLSGTQGNGVFLCENKNNFIDLMHLINETKTNVNK